MRAHRWGGRRGRESVCGVEDVARLVECGGVRDRHGVSVVRDESSGVFGHESGEFAVQRGDVNVVIGLTPHQLGRRRRRRKCRESDEEQPIKSEGACTDSGDARQMMICQEEQARKPVRRISGEKRDLSCLKNQL